MNACDVRQIVHAIASEFGVTYDELVGPRRYQRLVDIRRVAARRLRQERMSLPGIGQALGGRDHTTVMNLLGLIVRARKAPCWDGDHMCKDCAA